MLLSRCLSKRYRTIINSSSSCSSSIQCNIPKLSTCFKKFHSSNKKDSKREFDADELLHRSSIPTDHFQRSLPRLPIPKLHDTCSRYSQSVQPLIPQHKQHFSVDKTVQSLQEYHNELVQLDKSNKQTSYISGPWYDMYLKYRPALVFNHNPFVVFNPDPRKLYNTQIVRATNMIVSAMKFMKTYRAGLLEPEVFHLNPKKSDTQSFRNFVKYLPQAVSWYGAYWYKAFPLDMSQFPRLFNSTRIPRLVKDELLTDETARHIAVQRKGHIYIFDVINEDGRIAPPGDIMANIQYILNDDIGECEHPIGALTSEHRDTWAQLRESLVNNGNEEALRLVDTAVFMLSLDDYSPKHETDVKGMSSQFLHGRASNRWYDKSFSLLFAADGTASVNFEHSWGDGVAVLRFFNEVFKDTTSNPSVHPDSKPSSIDSSQSVRRIKFQLNDEVKSGIKTALEKFDQKVKTLDLDYFVMDAFGSKYLKSKKISPDAFMQLAFQMAYHKQSNGRTVGSYESCSTSAFKHGRTETIRPCTLFTRNTSEMFNTTTSEASPQEMENSIRQCSDKHNELTKNAAMGQGFDRHLFAMKSICLNRGDKLPDIYEEPGYNLLNHNIISTSTLSSPSVLIGGFAPVVSDGYGIGYAIMADKLGCIVTSYPPETNVSEFVDCVKQSVKEMNCVLDGKHFR